MLLPSVPFLALVFGTPVVVLALLPAHLLWQRLTRAHRHQLSRLYLSSRDAAQLAPRAASAARACATALAVGGLVGTVLALWPGNETDTRTAAVAGPVGAAVALVILGSWPAGRASRTGRHPLELRVLGGVGALAGVVALVAVVCGLVSVPSTPSGRFTAFPRPSLIEWYYSFDGVPKDFEWTAHGVTEPWPGWFYGIPVLAGTVGLLALAVVCLTRLRRWDFAASDADAPASDSAGDGVLRRLIAVVTAITAMGLIGGLIFEGAMAGEVLRSVSLFPKPQLPGAGVIKPYGHTQPEYALGLLGSYCWIVLAPAAVVLGWIAVFAVRDLRAAASAARAVMVTTR